MMINTGFNSLLPNDQILKALQDKSLEKRKNAAMEIQREIEELVAKKDDAQIEAKIKQFDLCT
jgi:hypothetical protein